MRSVDTVEEWTEAHLALGHKITAELDEAPRCSCGSFWSMVQNAAADPVPKPNGWTNRADSPPPSHPFATPQNEVPPDDATLEAIIEDLRNWWHTTAENDFAEMEPKIGEYTASDLVLMGQFLEHWLALPPGSGPEAACAFYALGKIARSVAAYREGRLPSNDTLYDLCVYSMMMRRIRENGQWP